MTHKSLEICYDFPFFLQEELDEIFQAHEKSLFRKVILFLRKERWPMNTIFWIAVWPVHL
jgi:hypothetical protein